MKNHLPRAVVSCPVYQPNHISIVLHDILSLCLLFQKALCDLGWASLTGVIPCNPCPQGAYADHQGSTECQACPPATTTELEGATSVTQCLSQCSSICSLTICFLFIFKSRNNAAESHSSMSSCLFYDYLQMVEDCNQLHYSFIH